MQKFGIGQPVRRVEDKRFITGEGEFAEDLAAESMVWAAFARSTVARADLLDVRTDAAKALPGVIAVYVAADCDAAEIESVPVLTSIDSSDGTPMATPPHPVLAGNRVNHVGECVAMVVAETWTAALDAAELVEIDYDDLEPVVEIRHAVADGAVQLYDNVPGNVAFDWNCGDAAATDAEFEAAAHTVSVDLINNKIVCNPLETRGLLVHKSPDSGKWALTGSVQNVFNHRRLLTKALGWAEDEIEVYAKDVGGGFGNKNQVQSEHIMCMHVAKRLDRPVKWVSSRTEAFLTESHARALDTRVELALDADHRFTGLRIRTLADLGAYCSTNGPLIPTGATSVVLGGAYALPNISMNVRGVFTNTVPTDAYRGAGRPEATYLLERVIDAAAHDLSLDPVALRRKNLIAPTQLPYTTAMAKTIDCGEFETVLDLALIRGDWDGFENRRAQSEASGKLRGRGLAFYLECTLGLPTEYCNLAFDDEGMLTITVGTQSNGQGHETTFAQLAAENLGIPFESIRFLQSDTRAMPTGGGHGGSRSTQLGGAALHHAAFKLIDKAKAIAGHLLETSVGDIELDEGRFKIVGTDRSISWTDVIAASFNGAAEAIGLERGLDGEETYTRENHTFPNGCHIAEVEVDPATGALEILNFQVVDDFGRVINPLIVRGQILGGVVQGLGQAVLEHTVYDPDSGQLLAGSFMDYTMPRADDLPPIGIEFFENAPSPSNPLGIKGCGEAGTIAAPPAIVNAVVDALRPRGVRHIDMPLTREKVWRAAMS